MDFGPGEIVASWDEASLNRNKAEGRKAWKLYKHAMGQWIQGTTDTS